MPQRALLCPALLPAKHVLVPHALNALTLMPIPPKTASNVRLTSEKILSMKFVNILAHVAAPAQVLEVVIAASTLAEIQPPSAQPASQTTSYQKREIEMENLDVSLNVQLAVHAKHTMDATPAKNPTLLLLMVLVLPVLQATKKSQANALKYDYII